MKHVLVVSLGLMTALSTPVLGQQRNGLHLAVGAGAGLGAWDVTVEGQNENSGTSAFTIGFEIGFHASPTVTVYYVQRTAWFNSDVTILPGPFGGPLTPQQVGRTLTHGLSGLGLTLYLSPSLRSLFLTGGLGLAWWSQVFDENTDCIKFPLIFPCVDISGVGAGVGAGYHVSKRIGFELFGMWGHPSGAGVSRFNVVSNSTAVSLTAKFAVL